MLPVADGDLSSWIKLHIGDPLIQKFFGCLASGVAYLHGKNVRHKDIKPPNLLVCGNEILLTDFGSSGKWHDSDQSITRGKVAYAYTEKYAPLEVLDESVRKCPMTVTSSTDSLKQDRNRGSDIFSLGCVFLEMVSALLGYLLDDVAQYLRENGTYSPWYGDNEPAVDSWIDTLRAKTSSSTHSTVLDMTRRMMDTDKSKRPTASTLVDCMVDLGTDFACKSCHQERSLKYLESKRIYLREPHTRGPALCEAARTGDLDIFQHLLRVTDYLSCTTDHNGEKLTTTELAATLDYSKIVQSFLSYCRRNSMYPDVTGPLTWAVLKSSHRTVEVLLDFGANPYDSYVFAGRKPYSTLYYAAYWGKVEVLKLMVKRGFDLSHKDSTTGQTVLHGAVRGEMLDTLKHLLAHDLDVNAKDNDGVTPIHETAIRGSVDMVALLAQAGADPNICDDKGYYPISRAVQCNHAQVIAPLVSAGADPRLFDSDGGTAAGRAARDGKQEVLEAILDSTGPENHYVNGGGSPLHLAVWTNHTSVVGMLLERTPRDVHHATEDSKGTPLHYAAQYGSEATIKLLLALPHAPTKTLDYRGYTPLRVATEVRKDYGSIARLFVVRDPGTINMRCADGSTPLSCAVRDEASEFARFLVEKGADLELTGNARGGRPLHIAASLGKTSMTRLLLDLGARVDAQDSRGYTPLLLAAQNGKKEVVELLLKRGAPIDSTNSRGRTASFLAAINGHVTTIKLLGTKGDDIKHILMRASECGELKVVLTLLDAGADINTRDSAQRSALMLAIGHGQANIVKTLLERGCEAEMKNAKDMNPLMLAARLNDKGTVKSLIDHGVSLDVQDESGKTALSMAAREGYTEIGRLLVAGGANVDLTRGHQPTPLYRAAFAGHDEIARVLVGGGADVRRAIRYGTSHSHSQDAVNLLKRLERDRTLISRSSQRGSRA
ncbi:Ankyrin repeat domain-containing protein 50 [Diplodia seriata]|uniref:Ankyrin repeat domain-containing protein 50 n=1 Tax=Diplodia seriata TaxID=420778 RepID=A0A1S8BJQ2_9PEZI|nr:Ankyrin repeat domain-containing protein 50 [Diplodia seriata]